MNFFKSCLTSRTGLAVLLIGILVPCGACAQFRGEGFGGLTVGGDAAVEIEVTRLDDAKSPSGTALPGTFRWAVEQKTPRKVVFTVTGDIVLDRRLEIKTAARKNLTVAGSTAPGKGICIRGAEIAIRETEQIIFRHVRLRRGRDGVTPFPKPAHTGSSANLDCLELRNVRDVLFDHVSFSWSCDELVGITLSQNVTFQWCIFAEPLGDVAFAIHPYGVNHSAALNISSSTVSVHHSLISNFRFRGPQFEANDVRDSTPVANRSVKLESVNNVVFNYSESGGRYTTGAEKETPANAEFLFHFVNNRYFSRGYKTSIPEIWANDIHAPTATVKVYVNGNIGPNRPNNTLPQDAVVFTRNAQGSRVPIALADGVYKKQLSATPLFTHPAAQQITLQDADDNLLALVLANAGARPESRDATDIRIVSYVPQGAGPGVYTGMVKNPREVGGWPDLSGSTVVPASHR